MRSIILTHDTRSAAEVQGMIPSYSGSIVTSNLDDLKGRDLPLMIDNHALFLLLTESLAQIEAVKAENASLREQIKQDILGVVDQTLDKPVVVNIETLNETIPAITLPGA